MRIGKLQVVTAFSSGESSTNVFDIIEENYGDYIAVGYSQSGTSIPSITWKYGVDITDTEQLDEMFNYMGTNTYTWTTPMYDCTASVSINNGDDLDDFKTPGTYHRAYSESSTNVVDNVPDLMYTSTFVLEVFYGGVEGQIVQRATRCHKGLPYVCHRVYYANSWGAWTSGDMVIEQGTSGIWTYRKWASGLAECWGSKSVSYTPAVGDTSFTVAASDYPFAFSTLSYKNAHIIYTSGTRMLTLASGSGAAATSKTSTGAYKAIADSAYAATTATTAYIQYEARGTV